MSRNQSVSSVVTVAAIALAALVVGFQVFVHAQNDPVVAKIIQLGTTDNQVMTWNDYASNRFGGRETGTNAYTDATEWAVWQFKQWGIDAELDEAGEVPVGFNRGPWFGKMLKPAEKALRFGTPSFTAGTKGVQKGGVVILKADPFSIPGANTTPENIEKKTRRRRRPPSPKSTRTRPRSRASGCSSPATAPASRRDGRRGTPEYADSQLIPPLTKALVDAGALGTIQSAKPTTTTRRDDGGSELAADQHSRRLRGVLGQAARAARHQAARTRSTTRSRAWPRRTSRWSWSSTSATGSRWGR